MTRPTVRAAGTHDWQALRAVRLQALADAPAAFCFTRARESAFTEAQWRQRATQGNWFLAWPATPSGTQAAAPEGVASGVLRPGSGGCELAGMWVGPAARGSDVAGELIAAVAGWARRSGAGRLDLWVFADNRRARAFYRRQGFLETGETQEAAERPAGVEIGMTLPLI